MILTHKKNKEEKIEELEDDDEKLKQALKHERDIEKNREKIVETERIIDEIRKWGERYGKELEIGIKRSNKVEDISEFTEYH